MSLFSSVGDVSRVTVEPLIVKLVTLTGIPFAVTVNAEVGALGKLRVSS